MNKHLIISNDPFAVYGDYGEMEKAMLDNDTDEAIPNEDAVWRWVGYQLDFDWEMFLDDLRRAQEKDPCMWLVTGKLGLWNGTQAGGKIFSDLTTAIYDMIANYEYAIYEDPYGNVTARCAHHDGVNHFKLYRISEKGEEWIERNSLWNGRRYLCESLEKRKPLRKSARLREYLGWIESRKAG